MDMENISFQYPTWYVVLCILLGLGYSLVLYFRDTTFGEQSRFLNGGLGALRFTVVTLLAVLLLSPLLKSITTETKKPVVILAQDQSESIAAGMDQEAMSAYRSAFEELSRRLGNEYELQQYAFSGDVRDEIDFEFTGKVTNISKLLTTVFDLYSNQNLGAVIVATDGIYNEGSNPVYVGTRLSAPIFTVALGDTTQKRDLTIRRIFHNRIAYLGDKFSVQIDIAAQNCSGVNSNLSIYKVEGGTNRLLQQLPVNIDRNDFFSTREVILDADQSGVQRFRITLSPAPGEATTANNSKDIFIDVLDARQKILLLANSPHPDLSAIRQSIGTNKNYQVDIGYINDLKVKISDYNFVIMHQLPSRTNDAAAALNVLEQNKIPRLFIVGSQTNFPRFNQVQSLISIRSDGRNTNEVQGTVAGGFNLFTVGERVDQQLSTFPPLTAPFGEFDLQAGAQTLLYQRIGKIDTRFPLLLLGEPRGIREGVLCAEGIWKWRLFDFLQHRNHDIFDELLGKTVQYVSLKEDKRKFRVNLSKNIFNENEPIVFDAELYNDNYEQINDPDVSMVITSGDGREFNFVFNKTNRAYSLNAGILPVGNYTFRASVFFNAQNLTYAGQFSVQPIQLELYETTADHNLLQLLSEKYGGAMVYPDQTASIADLIKERGTVKPVIYQTAKTRLVINLKWIFFLLLGLLSVEWFFRRYFGGY
jgi:hypothetical protein